MIYVILMIVCFILLMAIRVPIPFALLVSTLVYYLGADLPLNIVIVRLLRSFDSFILLAIPFFVLAGRIMSEAGISDRLVKVSDLLVGRVKGSLAYVNIVVSMFFGGITGTAISDTTAIGSILIPSMVKKRILQKIQRCGNGGIFHHGTDYSAQPHVYHLRVDCPGVHPRPFPGWRHSGHHGRAGPDDRDQNHGQEA